MKRLTIWIDSSTLTKLKAMAKVERRSLGWIIRELLKESVTKKK